MNLDEINRLIQDLPESNPRGDKWYLENKLDQLSWKLEKTLYHKNRINLIYENLDNNLQTIKQECMAEYNEAYSKLFAKQYQKLNFKYDFEISQDKDLFFEMESFIISAKSSIDLLVKKKNIYIFISRRPPNSICRVAVHLAAFATLSIFSFLPMANPLIS